VVADFYGVFVWPLSTKMWHTPRAPAASRSVFMALLSELQGLFQWLYGSFEWLQGCFDLQGSFEWL